MSQLSVMQWNACSLNHTRQLELQHKCSATDIDIVVICEAKTQHTLKRFDDYLQFVNNDTLMLVNKRLKFEEVVQYKIEEDKHVETIAIAIEDMLLIGVYCRDGSKPHGIRRLMDMLQWARLSYDTICVIGDLNARASLVYDVNGRRNAAGVELDKHLDNGFLTCVNDGTHTFSRPGFATSLLDVILVTSDLMSQCTAFSVMDWFDSDHKPIVCRFGHHTCETNHTQYAAQYSVRALNLLGKDLTGLGDQIDKIMQDDVMWQEEDSDGLYEHIKSTILFGLKRCGVLRSKRKKPSKAWFDNHIRDLIRQRDQARYSHSPDAHQTYVDLKKAVKQAVRTAKRQKWHDFIASIQYDDSAAMIWRKFRQSRGTQHPFDTIGDLDTQTHKIAQDFKNYSRVALSPVQHYEDNYSHITSSWLNNGFHNDSKPYNRIITSSEVRLAIQHCKSKSAPGPDGIPYTVYKCLPDSMIDKITTLFNMWYDTGDMPTECDKALQVAIPKSAPGEFRPITLKNALPKIFERVLYSRIYNWIDDRLPEYQFGFRRGLGCREQITRLLSRLQQQRQCKKTSVVLFLDIRKAYDRVYRRGLIAKLHQLGLRGKMLKMIDRIIMHTKCRVLNRNHVSDEYEPSEGIPQGGILSCLLFNIFFSDLPDHTSDDTMFAAYADDLAIVVSADKLSEANYKMTHIYDDIRTWAVHNRVDFNDKKVKAMIIRPKWKRKRQHQHTFYLDRVLYADQSTGTIRRVQVVDEYKYLGAIIDSKLTLTPWINAIVANATHRISLVKRVAQTTKLPRHLVEKFYDGYVRGYLRYGIEIWSQTSSANKVYNIDRAGQRMCAGLLHATRNIDVERESNMVSLKAIAHYSIIRMIFTKLRNRNTPMRHFFSQAFSDVNMGTLVSKMTNIWYCAALPILDDFTQSLLDNDDWNALYYSIEALRPSREKKQWVYRDCFWQEKLLSRFRAGVQPTRVWAKRVGLEWSDKCRHCKQAVETLDHLILDQCPHLEYKFGLTCKFGVSSTQELRQLLWSDHEDREVLEDHLVEMSRKNKLFARKTFDVH